MIISVVGHGASFKPEFGPQIDSSDLVVRMLDCEWHTPDMGTRYDYGFMKINSGNTKQIQDLHEKKKLKHPKNGWWISIARSVSEYHDILSCKAFYGRTMEMTDVFVPQILGAKKVTRGALAALYALFSRKPRKLMLWGFDALVEGKETANHPRYPKGIPNPLQVNGYWVHDFRAEKKRIKEVSVLTNTEVYYNGDKH